MPAKSKSELKAALIIAGGRGTRFWPASRTSRPKPLFTLDGNSTLITDTIARHQPLIPRERIFVLVPAEQRDAFAPALKGAIPPKNLLVEPQGRGTTVAIAYGWAIIRQRLGDVSLVVAPADHYVTPDAGFRKTLAEAFDMARRREAIVVIGVTPIRADSGYGYMKIGETAGVGFKVERFVEKPPPARARAMVRSGKYLWNAGLFVMSGETLASELSTHCAPLAKIIEQPAAEAVSSFTRAYGKLKLDAFDREVVEKSDRVFGVRARFRWHDVGSWHGLWEALCDSDGNAFMGNVMSLESQGVLARSSERLIVLLGVDDLVVVDDADALLVARRSRSQDVRRVIDELERRRLHRYL
jgi:mannose-1-phosphate guanylyltransferase/mannose-6-phosphate isomerase